MVKNPSAKQETGVLSLSQGRSPEEGNDNPLLNSCLENPMEPGGLQSVGFKELDMT